jgi:hypothetical protein
MRTTVDIDDPILRELKTLQKKRGQSLGRLVSDLLARAIRRAEDESPPLPNTHWISKPMRARVDLADKEALRFAMEQSDDATDAPRPG